MAIQTVTMRNALVDAYKTQAAFATVYSAAPGATQGTEPTGGAPAFARKASNWGATATSAATAAPAAFDIPSGFTVGGVGFHTLVTGGVYVDGTSVTSQPFNSQGTYSLTAQYTQS